MVSPEVVSENPKQTGSPFEEKLFAFLENSPCVSERFVA
jgi:hypothetical protein